MIMNAPSNNRKYLKAFINHKNRFGKTHANQEELSYRYAIYASNMEFIEAHNKKGKTFTCGENQFTDMTFTEFKSKYLSSVPVQHTLKRENVGEIVKGGVDWVAQGKVSDVKNQKACGSCWAFSTTGSMESAYRIFKNEDLEFSEQELVDCSGSYGNMGCNGGIMSAAFDYIQDSELTTEDYRYTARRGSCKSKRYTNRYGINGYEQISPIDVSGLMSALDQQPVSVFSPQELAKRQGGAYRGPQVVNGKVAFWAARVQFAGRLFPTRVPKDGWYKVTIHNLKGVNPGPDGAVWASLRTGQNNSSSPIQYYQASIEATPTPKDYTYTFWMDQGHNLELKPNESGNKIPKGDFQKGGRLNYGDRDYQKEGYAGLIYDSITMERVYPGGGRQQVMKGLYPGVKIVDGKPQIEKSAASVSKLVARFAWVAYRRPVKGETLAAYQKLATDEFRKSKDFNKALKAGYRAVLCSPRFLTLVEKPGKLDDHAIASRLSYFLWSSMPDWELRKAADAGKLNTPEQIRAQVARMLNHRKAERFVENFTDQWLMLSEIGFTTPDPRRFRRFDPILQDSMLQETRTFFRTLLKEDLSVRNFIKSDFGFLNTRLATHYGMQDSGIKVGQGLQRVPLKPGQRNGLVTQGAVLKVTADGSVTSPVIRGVFIGERILGLHIPPPPENVPAIEPDIRGAKSIRDQLEKHRESISCSSCHEKIDPAGFALETFDPIGNMRKFYGQPNKSAQVDSSGVTLDGKEFRGIFEWKNLQANKPDQLARAFAEQLIAYSTGAKIRFSDRPELQEIVKAAREKNHGVRSIIAEVATSDMFLNK